MLGKVLFDDILFANKVAACGDLGTLKMGTLFSRREWS